MSVLTLPQGTKFVVVEGGTVRHIKDEKGEQPGTWCHMIYDPTLLNPYRVRDHGELPICGACLRTTRARKYVR